MKVYFLEAPLSFSEQQSKFCVAVQKSKAQIKQWF